MTIEENKAIMCRLLDEIVNHGNSAIADELVASDGDESEARHTGATSYRTGVKRYFIMLRTAFPDLKVTIEEQVAEEDKVVHLTRWQGTHQGDYYDIPATGKHVSFAEIVIGYLRDGMVTKHIAIADQLDIMQQLGITRIPEEAGG